MPGYLLNSGSLVRCSHFGTAKPDAPSVKLKVMGQPAVLQTCPYTVAGCALQPPPNGNGPCVKAQWTTAALRVKSFGVPVLLADSKSLCTPTASPLTVALTQVRVKGK